MSPQQHQRGSGSRSSSQSASSRSRSPSSEPDEAAATERLAALARQAHASRIPYVNDDSEHYKLFSRALSNVLSTQLALFTFAQIIDGLLTADVAWDCRFPLLTGDHSIEQHEIICPGTLDKARDFRESFDPNVLLLDPKLLQSFRRASVASRLFSIRLIELVAVAMHQIGAFLFQLGLRMHDSDTDSIDQWVDPRDLEDPNGGPVNPRPTLFNHHAYIHHDIYPNGVADMVGYWAENHVLGGVTVFDRQAEQRTPAFPPNPYFHSCRRGVTYRYYQLRDEQLESLLAFLMAKDPDPANSPLPILADDRNLVRVNEEHAIQQHLYRDEWERKPPTYWHLQLMQRVP